MNKTIKIKLDSKIYPIEAIIYTAYNFIDKIYFFLDTDSKEENKIIISIRGKSYLNKNQQEKFKSHFLNELLYSVLRCKISKKNRKIREYIISRALFPVIEDNSMLNNSDDNNDYKNDPLGIAIPWEEKYAKKRKEK